MRAHAVQDVVAHDELLAALKAIRASDMSISTNGFIASNSVVRDRPIQALLFQGGSAVASATQHFFSSHLISRAAQLIREERQVRCIAPSRPDPAPQTP